jgi:calcineurin-like phosphoesterase family protein
MIFFTSDLHFYHRNVLTYCQRPFKDVYHMHEVLISNWNATVATDDLVYILGDFAFGSLAKIAAITQRLSGHKVLVRGNHDDRRVLQQENWAALGFDCVFNSEPGGVELEIAPGLTVRLSHYPYVGAGDSSATERFPERRCIDNGGWLLHGHCHGCLGQVRDRMIDVGVDADPLKIYAPIPLDRILQVITALGPLDPLKR